jgi:hypothetical protein
MSEVTDFYRRPSRTSGLGRHADLMAGFPDDAEALGAIVRGLLMFPGGFCPTRGRPEPAGYCCAGSLLKRGRRVSREPDMIMGRWCVKKDEQASRRLLRAVSEDDYAGKTRKAARCHPHRAAPDRRRPGRRGRLPGTAAGLAPVSAAANPVVGLVKHPRPARPADGAAAGGPGGRSCRSVIRSRPWPRSPRPPARGCRARWSGGGCSSATRSAGTSRGDRGRHGGTQRYAAARGGMRRHAAACGGMRRHAAACGGMRRHAAAPWGDPGAGPRQRVRPSWPARTPAWKREPASRAASSSATRRR